MSFILNKLIVCRQRVLGLWSLLLPSLLVVLAVVAIKMAIELVGVYTAPPWPTQGFIFTAVTYGKSCWRYFKLCVQANPWLEVRIFVSLLPSCCDANKYIHLSELCHSSSS